MSEETIQLIAAAVVTLTQIYMLEPWKIPIFAWFWDQIARFTGELANVLGYVSLKARMNYYHAIMENQ